MTAKPVQIKISDCVTVPCPLCDKVKNRPVATGLDTEYGTCADPLTFVVCHHCGHTYLNPCPTMDKAALMYPGDYYTLAGRHGKKGSTMVALLKRFVIRRRLAFFETVFARKQAAILEVGCGDCALLIELKKTYPHLACTGVDLAFGPSDRLECERLGIQLIEQTVETAELEPAKYDLVIMNQIIEHLWKPRPVLHKLAAAMQPGGLISIETVNLDGYDRRFFYDGTWGGYYFPRHLNLFSSKSLASLLQQTGFRVVKSYSLLAPIVWIFSLRAWLTVKIGDLPNLRRLLNDKNPLALTAFALIDALALFLGETTSNQKIIAKKL